MDILGHLDKRNYAMQEQAGMTNSLAKPRTIEETIADTIAYHERKLVDLRAAQEVLKKSGVLEALEALQKLSY